MLWTVTIAPKTNDDNATFGLLDGADDVLDDADDDADGFQVDLNEGANTIKVRVTAEDGTTSATYRVVVTRRVVVVSTLVSMPDSGYAPIPQASVAALHDGRQRRRVHGDHRERGDLIGHVDVSRAPRPEHERWQAR